MNVDLSRPPQTVSGAKNLGMALLACLRCLTYYTPYPPDETRERDEKTPNMTEKAVERALI
jgi:hypothetical protein